MERNDQIERMRWKSMSPTARYNLRIAPIVILVRIPILLPFWFVAHIGRAAEGVGNWIDRRIPGFRP